MTNPLIRKLSNFTRLSDEEKLAIEALVAKTKRIGAKQDIIREGDAPGQVHLVLDGFACRYKTLPDGRRKILAYFVPGDFCELRVFIMSEMDHSICTITPSTLASMSQRSVLELADKHPRIIQALWWSAMVDEAITREWLLNIGKRNATERAAHFLCEHYLRMRAVGLTQDNTCDLPMTQAELGDTLGLSVVHTNRTVQGLRAEGLIHLQGKSLKVLDLTGLQDLAMFNPNYLHFNRKPPDETSNDLARTNGGQRGAPIQVMGASKTTSVRARTNGGFR